MPAAHWVLHGRVLLFIMAHADHQVGHHVVGTDPLGLIEGRVAPAVEDAQVCATLLHQQAQLWTVVHVFSHSTDAYEASTPNQATQSTRNSSECIRKAAASYRCEVALGRRDVCSGAAVVVKRVDRQPCPEQPPELGHVALVHTRAQQGCILYVVCVGRVRSHHSIMQSK